MTTQVRTVWNAGIYIAATLAGLSVVLLLFLRALTFPLAPHDVHVFTWGVCTGVVLTLLPVAVLVATWIVARRSTQGRSKRAVCEYSLEGLVGDRCPECGSGSA